MARCTKTEAMFSVLNYIAGIDITYLAVGANFGDFGSIGLSIKSLDFGDIPITTYFQPDGTGDNYSPSFIVLGLTYSKAMTNNIYFGLNAKVVNEQIEHMTNTGMAFDLGLQYEWKDTGFNFGIVMKNVGPSMNFDGSDTEVFNELEESEAGSKARPMRLVLQEFELPTSLEMSSSYTHNFAQNMSLTGSAAFQNFNYGYDKARVGAEYEFQKFFFLRAGYEYALIGGDDSDNSIFGPSFGLGLNAAPLGFDLQFDYTYRTVDFFEPNQYFTVKLAF
jgi:hypothetical protein